MKQELRIEERENELNSSKIEANDELDSKIQRS